MSTFPNVLILEADDRSRRKIADALGILGAPQVLQAANADMALALLRTARGVGVGICGLAAGHLEALAQAGQEGHLSALVLVGNSGEVHRQARRLSQIGRLPILGCLDLPIRGHELAEVLARFSTPQRRDDTVLPAEDELHTALLRDEFQPRFQPIFDLPRRQPCSVELGVVWDHPLRGELAAHKFIPAMLAYDLIDELFGRLLEHGLECLAWLQEAHPTLRLTCNLQASQLHGRGFAEHLQARMAQRDINPGRVVFELGENGLLDLPSYALEQLNRLRALGCGLSVDQFGSGFSSLQLLCRRPFQQLKLAPQFARELEHPSGRALVTSTLALAQSLNMQVVVGGVSKASQHQALLEMGCPQAQGSYYAPAMSGAAFRDWLRSC